MTVEGYPVVAAQPCLILSAVLVPTTLSNTAADEPLRHYLSELRGLFPALPAPLYTLLGALASSATAAADAAGFLAGLPAPTCLHASGERGLARDAGAEERVVAGEYPLAPQGTSSGQEGLGRRRFCPWQCGRAVADCCAAA